MDAKGRIFVSRHVKFDENNFPFAANLSIATPHVQPVRFRSSSFPVAALGKKTTDTVIQQQQHDTLHQQANEDGLGGQVSEVSEVEESIHQEQINDGLATGLAAYTSVAQEVVSKEAQEVVSGEEDRSSPVVVDTNVADGGGPDNVDSGDSSDQVVVKGSLFVGAVCLATGASSTIST
ncbi:hypothetical protein V6N11_017935 [Hibiscus sabdariffa]|uniref:Uncharacterized protein n=1 Tax=Hibiscus sabdariffa TaxID=183260 RepID=A0ABR2T5V8_9ROSI